MRDSNGMTPGKFYMITDYECTTRQWGTKSAGRKFGVLVRATSNHTLSEDARIYDDVSGGYYSTENHCNAWDAKYCLDNDTERFAWAANESYQVSDIESISNPNANTTAIQALSVLHSGGAFVHAQDMDSDGYRYYVLCENENDASTRYVGTMAGTEHDYTYVVRLRQSDSVVYGNELKINLYNLTESYLDTSYFVYLNVRRVNGINKGKGVIYWMRDEYGNECPYDFKNIMFARSWVIDHDESLTLNAPFGGKPDNGADHQLLHTNVTQSDGFDYSTDIKYLFTFSYVDKDDMDTIKDATDYGNVIFDYEHRASLRCSGNVIKPQFYNSRTSNSDGTPMMTLNNIVFYAVRNKTIQYIESDLVTEITNNTFDFGCRDMTFYGNQTCNTFGKNCDWMSFNGPMSMCEFGSGCNYFYFNGEMDGCSFGRKCNDIFLLRRYKDVKFRDSVSRYEEHDTSANDLFMNVEVMPGMYTFSYVDGSITGGTDYCMKVLYIDPVDAGTQNQTIKCENFQLNV